MKISLIYQFISKMVTMRRVIAVAPIVFSGILVYSISTSINSKKKVFILHSYHPEYAWVRDLNLAWKRTISNKDLSVPGEKYMNVRYFYMDTKRYPSKISKLKSASAAIETINSWNPDILVAFDDDAQEFVAKKYIDRDGLSIVYAGVNNPISTYGYNSAKNVYGIREHVILRPLLNALDLRNGTSWAPPLRIAHISDRSIFSSSISRTIREFNWSPHTLVSSDECESFDEWKKAIFRANLAADVIYIPNYHTLSSDNGVSAPSSDGKVKRTVEGSDVIAWTLKNAKIPLIGRSDFLVEDGGMLSVGSSPYEQGEKAANLVISLSKGENIPLKNRHLHNKDVIVAIRKSQYNFWKWTLPRVYISYARATANYFP